MRKFLFLLILIIAASIAYGIFAFPGGNATNAVVKLVGPGNTPSVCVERARPHFEKMESAFNEIAKALLASEDIIDIGYSLGRHGEPYLHVKTDTGFREPTSDEVSNFIPKFQSLGKRNYYLSGDFRKRQDSVVAITNAICGTSILNWIKFRLGMEPRHDDTPMALTVAFVYWPADVPELEKCVEPVVLDRDEGVICEVALNKKWTWYSEWNLISWLPRN